MKPIKNDSNFMNNDFLLENETAKILYHQYAAKMPVVDYHNHLSAEKIAKNKGFKDITEAWLSEDHYKWRGMRANGVDEKYITGNATSYEKFEKWAATVPYTVRNPLFHWTHLELKKYFGITDILQPSNCKEIYNQTSKVLQNTTPQDLLRKANVEIVCTTDDPTDDLKYHIQIAKGNFSTKVLPTFRADNIIHIEADSFVSYVNKLAKVADVDIKDLPSLLKAIQQRIDFFASVGCRLSDFGLTGSLVFNAFDEDEVSNIIHKKINGTELSIQENEQYRSCLLYHLAVMYHAKNWAQQYHLGPIRNNNSRLIKEFGADAGCDSIGDYNFATQLSKFFDRLDSENKLAKTITYNLNPAHNEVFATMMGNFNTGGTPGKMQWGSAWWFLDQKSGMKAQLDILSNIGLLSRFVGMLTDSRSFLSFPRHEYFRRILCNEIAKDVENGEIPKDMGLLGKMIEDICYNNAINYFNF
ncbi:glucuronate isomerase [Wenyingzhuangia aestuarii]|uniref:glucuronate isomerase n=1 Tax=Wenyingzhuangia aestuarii TaxID=1647582 RepID=UPI00143A0235|nr:glucuronate isomerase [Wenyingzhuangia aestuarii]NJB83962.1 glucuronate isomerase [Wenyingzhuangia aestuarii]